ncbi:hypothetical protein GTP41_20550 [Pseudoduganella sp. DS3]|uniref:Exo-alpha-sialidase n=1 Tax=Pseudoduganella guangdongensis TaxID=2692179 RepID=A0A6N9HM74_9BURK|nr:hypothetical protein [Pseudoduganella guangdongensis]MYN04486.1 hypothetical protein [Pseudoduganella guangdongensis]
MTWINFVKHLVKLRLALALAIAFCCISAPANAYEFENAVPLTLGMQSGAPYVSGARIQLKGHEVDIAITLKNDTRRTQKVGFYAATPLFEYFGEGEEYGDKTFPELTATLDGKALTVARYPHTYFLGRDMGPYLRKAQLKDWQSQLTYGWSGRIAPESTAIQTVRYSALPRFGLETIDHENLTRLVQQHCGQPDELRQLLKGLAPEETQVFAEVFEFPLPLLKLQDTQVSISQPAKRWMGTRPVAALACGFDGPLHLPSEGTIHGANHALSILVVSLLASAPEEGKENAMPATQFKVGNVTISEDSERVRVQAEPPITLQTLPAGRIWPPLQLDESGRIHAGALIVDPASGKHLSTRPGAALLPNGLEVSDTPTGYALRHGRGRCTVSYKELGAPAGRSPLAALQAYNVQFSASSSTVLALVTDFLQDGQTRYHVQRIDPATCKSKRTARLGDPDLLVELGYSRRGGWWITGSTEQTLMASRDGAKWRRIQLPADLSSLISSYLVDDKQIWLAGILGDMDQHPHLLVYSADGGNSWTSLKAKDPLLDKLPAGWLEGQRRKVVPTESLANQ